MRVSFTGTQKGMTPWQSHLLSIWLNENKARVVLFAHGCCVGSDVEAHLLVRKICGPSVFIAVYPSTAKTRSAIPADSDYVAKPKPPLRRNPDIVEAGPDMLLATPGSLHEIQRSGTWSTIRYARRSKICCEIFYPDPVNRGEVLNKL